jgi:predicted methyltransferase
MRRLSAFLLATAFAMAPLAAQGGLEARPAYRYRVAIAGLLQLKPGMAVAEIGPGAGFLTTVIAPQVEPGGRAVALESTSGLQPAALDAVALVDAFTSSVRAADVLTSAAAALKSGGALLVVDIAREGVGAAQQGIDADDLVAAATAAGFTREAESGIVPGHFAIRFRKL